MGNHVIRDRIWRSRKLARCSKGAALAYPWVFLVADEWGRFEYRPHMIHGVVFGARMDFSPEDTPSVSDVTGWLGEYETVGLLVRYNEGELAFWTNFEGRSRSKRNASQYAEPPEFKSVRKNTREEQEQEQEGEQEQERNKPAGAGDSDSVRQVFEHWQATMGHASAKLTPKRRRLVQCRLHEGYTVAQLRDAVAGCKASPFHMGSNDSGSVYDDLTLICRSGEKVEFFLDKLRQRPGIPIARASPASVGQRAMSEAGKFLEAVRGKGGAG